MRTPGEGPGNAALVADGALPFSLATESTDTLLELFGSQAMDDAQSGSDISDTQQPLLVPETELPEVTATANAPSAPVQKVPPAPVTPAVPAPPTDSAVPTEAPNPSEASSASSDTAGAVVESDATEHTSRFGNCYSSLDMYADFCTKLVSLLGGGALSEEDIAAQLCIEKSQAKAWLKRAIDAGRVEKLKKPVRYSLGRQGSLC